MSGAAGSRGGDAVVAVLAVVSAVEAAAVGRPAWVAVLVAAWFLPLLWRGRFPFGAPIATVAAVTLSMPVAGAAILGIGGSGLATGAAVFFLVAALARRTTRSRVQVATVVGVVAVVMGQALLVSSQPADEAGLLVVMIGIIIAAGWTLPRRLDDARWARDAAAAADDDFDRSLADAVAAERADVAREMHDIVAHGVNVMIVQAAAARTLARTDPAGARRCTDAVATAGTAAVRDLQRLCDVLGGDASPLRPQPTLADLPRLLDTFRVAGLRLDACLPDAAPVMSPGVEVTAYRIVQEALTNAVKHAGDTEVRVVVEATDGHLAIEVVDDGPGGRRRDGAAVSTGAPGCGQGLVGMRERVDLYGGRLEAGRRGRGYAVAVSLPVDA